jgi:hypothetical protein
MFRSHTFVRLLEEGSLGDSCWANLTSWRGEPWFDEPEPPGKWARPDEVFFRAEILEFDAMEDPPTVMTLEVFDYDGPFSEAELLGRAEVGPGCVCLFLLAESLSFFFRVFWEHM